MELLLRFLTTLDRDIEIAWKPRASTSLQGKISFGTAAATPTPIGNQEMAGK